MRKGITQQDFLSGLIQLLCFFKEDLSFSVFLSPADVRLNFYRSIVNGHYVLFKDWQAGLIM